MIREDWPFRASLILLALVIGSQVALRFESARRFLNVAIRMEGDALSESVPGLGEEAYPWLEWPPPEASSQGEEWATLYLRFLGEPPTEAWVLVDGRVAKRLGPEGGTVTVKSGSLIEVYRPGGDLSVAVSAATPNLVDPPLGTWVTAWERARVGVVLVRDLGSGE
ncbi:MAG TPA: hypothetical protein GX500_00075 [Firmicutes bacterium]|nr:hypothetical protein [Candidatus Fermentithermobacillaceae bacterium]